MQGKATLLGCEQGTRVRSQNPHTKVAFIYEHLPMAKSTYTDTDVCIGSTTAIDAEVNCTGLQTQAILA